jgi:hypothetical protein
MKESPMESKNWTRRQVLRGAGVALSLPWLETIAPRTARAAAAGLPRRYITMYFPNGSPDYWHPTGAGVNYTLSPILEPLGPNKSRLLVLGNVGNYSPWGGHIEPSHGHNCATAFTGVRANGPGNANGSISVDQVIANQMVTDNGGKLPTALHSLQVGLSTVDASTDGLPGPHSRSISWKSASEPLYKIVSPQAAFDRIVGGGLPIPSAGGNTTPMPDPLAERRRQLKKSALDYINENATSVKSKVSTGDKARLDKFMTAVRTLEQRVAVPAMQVNTTPATCNGIKRPTEVFGVGNTPPDYNRGAHASLMIDLVVMAIQCDVTRVVSYMLDDARSEFVYTFLPERKFTATGSTPGTTGCQNYHGLQHGGNLNNGFATITWWNAERANELTTKLAAIKEGAGSIMDNTLITLMSGMHGGNHDGLDLPIVLIGNPGGVLKTGQYINFPASPGKNLQDMHLTVMQKVYGSPMQAFGAPQGGYTTAIIPEILA